MPQPTVPGMQQVLEAPHTSGAGQSSSVAHSFGTPAGQLSAVGSASLKSPVELFALWSWMLPPCTGPAWLYVSSSTWIENMSLLLLPGSPLSVEIGRASCRERV